MENVSNSPAVQLLQTEIPSVDIPSVGTSITDVFERTPTTKLQFIYLALLMNHDQIIQVVGGDSDTFIISTNHFVFLFVRGLLGIGLVMQIDVELMVYLGVRGQYVGGIAKPTSLT